MSWNILGVYTVWLVTLCFRRKGTISLTPEGLNGIDTILNKWNNLMVRSGELCVHSWFHKRNIDRERQKVRVSVYIYNTKEECELFVESLERILNLYEYRMLPVV